MLVGDSVNFYHQSRSDQQCHFHTEPSQLIYTENRLTVLYMIVTIIWI